MKSYVFAKASHQKCLACFKATTPIELMESCVFAKASHQRRQTVFPPKANSSKPLAFFAWIPDKDRLASCSATHRNKEIVCCTRPGLIPMPSRNDVLMENIHINKHEHCRSKKSARSTQPCRSVETWCTPFNAGSAHVQVHMTSCPPSQQL